MRRALPVLAALLCLLVGCARDMNWVISNEPSVCGVVQEIGEDYVLLLVSQSDEPEIAVGSLVWTEKATRLQDCKFSARVGDEVMAYYDGTVVLGGRPEIYNVHGYTLVEPIQREEDRG